MANLNYSDIISFSATLASSISGKTFYPTGITANHVVIEDYTVEPYNFTWEVRSGNNTPNLYITRDVYDSAVTLNLHLGVPINL